MAEPEIVQVQEKKLVGKKIRMSLIENKAGILWQSFMPGRKEIQNNLGNELISMQVYEDLPRMGDINQSFDKWAAVEVSDFESIPDGMESFILKSGKYAVFHYKGLSTDNSIFIYIFTVWLPSSGYQLDNRPHFEVLGERYKNNDPNSEEEIWIPIK